MFANVNRERERLVHAHPFGKIKVNDASVDGQVQRERDACFL